MKEKIIPQYKCEVYIFCWPKANLYQYTIQGEPWLKGTMPQAGFEPGSFGGYTLDRFGHQGRFKICKVIHITFLIYQNNLAYQFIDSLCRYSCKLIVGDVNGVVFVLVRRFHLFIIILETGQRIDQAQHGFT